MKESVDKVAVLENVDPETFELVMQFAYTGVYRAATSDEKTPLSLPNQRYCGACFAKLADGICPDGCKEIMSSLQLHSCVGCCARLSTNGLAFCHRCYGGGTQNRSFVSFFKLQYPLSNMSHHRARVYLAKLQPEDPPTSKLISHAKLFVFANMYLIDDLKRLCLHKLHRDLLAFNLIGNGVEDIIDLLEYSYNNTERADEDFPGVGVELRDLVKTYAVSMSLELVKVPAFRTVFVKGGDLAADLAYDFMTANK